MWVLFLFFIFRTQYICFLQVLMHKAFSKINWRGNFVCFMGLLKTFFSFKMLHISVN